jgi:hypothetical protein
MKILNFIHIHLAKCVISNNLLSNKLWEPDMHKIFERFVNILCINKQNVEMLEI